MNKTNLSVGGIDNKLCPISICSMVTVTKKKAECMYADSGKRTEVVEWWVF
jgi:hypothetical protein